MPTDPATPVPPTSPSPGRVTLIVPTRNEARNIDEFVKRSALALDGVEQWDILFADDSDDSTPEEITRLAGAGHPVACRHRPPSERRDSIAGAVSATLPHANGDIVVIIDGDLQHPPEILPLLIEPIASGIADVAIGSRYGSGGSAEGLGSPLRRAASSGSHLVTKLLFPHLARCSDLASGLVAFRLADLGEPRLRFGGFKILPEILVRTRPRVVADVPYIFEARIDGVSKASVRDGLNLLRQLARLRLSTPRHTGVALLKAAPERDQACGG